MQIGAALKAEQRPIDATAEIAKWNVTAEDLKNKVQAESADPNTWRNDYIVQSAQKKAEQMDEIQDPLQKQALQIHINKTQDNHIIELSKQAGLAARQQALGKMEVNGNALAEHAARTTDPRLAEIDKQEFRSMISLAESPQMIGGKPMPPALTRVEAEKARQKWDETVEKNRAYYKIESDPKGLIEELQNPEKYKVLTGPERNALKDHAEATINQRARLAKGAEQERIDHLNSNLLEQNVAGSLKIGDVLAMPDSVIPFKDKHFWVDRLTAQQKHDDKEIDPFEKSDGATRALVMNGVLTDPVNWTQDKILSYMGKGLSNTHALQLVNLQKELTKEKKEGGSHKYDPLNTALDTLNGLRRSYMFTKEGQDDKVTDATAGGKLRMKNDEEYQKVVDKVMAGAQAGEDPRAVMQEAMKPYFEQKTKGWFERWSNWLTTPLQATPTRPHEVIEAEKKQIEGLNKLDAASQRYRQALDNPDEAARQFLLQNGKVITPETLKRTKDYLKSKTGGK